MNDMSKVPNEYDYRVAVLDKLVQFKPIVEKALSHSREGHTFEDAFRLVASNGAVLFWHKESFAIVEWRNYPAGLTGHCLWAGGRYSELLELYEIVAKFARDNGARRITLLGRKGFMRRLPKAGWDIEGIWFSKDVSKKEIEA
jgi:hypothetical protein